MFPPISADFEIRWGGKLRECSPPGGGEILIFPSHNFTRFDASSPHLLGGPLSENFPSKNTSFPPKTPLFPIISPHLWGGTQFRQSCFPPKIMEIQNYGGEHTHIRFRVGGKSESWGEIQKVVPPHMVRNLMGALKMFRAGMFQFVQMSLKVKYSVLHNKVKSH